MTAGQDFVKKIGKPGMIIFSAMLVLFIIVCIGASRPPIKGYAAPHDTQYYAANTDELVRELEDNVIPHLSGVISCENAGVSVRVTIKESEFAKTRGAILRYFDKSLFEFVSSEVE